MAKIGLVLECTLQGADLQVYSLFARNILGDKIQIEPGCTGDKKNLTRNAGIITRSLFKEGCERVLIIWDLWPAWGVKGAAPSFKDDVKSIEASLRAAKVKQECVYLICVDRMLETLLIADGKAIREVVGVPKGRPGP